MAPSWTNSVPIPFEPPNCIRKKYRTSLVVQRLEIHVLMQGMQV